MPPEELGQVLAGLKTNEVSAAPATRLHSLWDRASFLWALGLLFAGDWYLRRRWGLS